MTQQTKPKILIIGAYGRGNIGDDAFLVVLYNLFSEKYQIVVNAAEVEKLPSEIKDKIEIIDTDFLKDPIKKLKVLLEIKSVIYGGGNLWLELIGEKFASRNLLKMLVVNLVVKILGKKIYYMGCGVGSLSSFSLKVAKLSAKFADFIIFREQESAKLIDANPQKYGILPDLTINLINDNLRNIQNASEISKIGISLLYYLPNPEVNFPLLVEKLADIINTAPSGLQFFLIPMQITSDMDKDDLWCSKQLLSKIHDASKCQIFESNSLKEYLELLSQMDLVIGTRLHSNILSVVTGTPVVGISYREKVKDFFKFINNSDKVVELSELNNLPNILENVNLDYANYKKFIQTKREELKESQQKYQDYAAKF